MELTQTTGARLLIVYTVGGSHEAVVASVKQYNPQRAVFVPSPETEKDIKDKILPQLFNEGIEVPPYEVKTVPDAQDFELCVKTLRELQPSLVGWIRQAQSNKAAVDLTGGTKLMSAALALVARTWPCEFLYVGGKQRTKGGLGVVVGGNEQFIHSANPWNSLGYQAIEEATLLFDEGNFAAAGNVGERARNRTTNASAKKVLQAFVELAGSYEAWDRFDHKAAHSGLSSVLKQINELGHAFPGRQHEWEALLKKEIGFLEHLLQPNRGSQFLADLLANAHRRAKQKRFDDAVARLYRTLEAAAQIRLMELGFPEAPRIPLAKLPPSLQARWGSRVNDGIVRLGLQDDYELLHTLCHALGQKFFELKLNEQQSPLTARNQSILAHGFQPVGESVFQDLWQRTLVLMDLGSDSLPEFPHLGGDLSC